MTSDGWYSQWFGDEYLQVYGHRDEEEASHAVRLILRYAEFVRSSRILDLACGAGRHLREFRRQGFAAFGLDLSLPLLRHARDGGSAVVRGDMRALPFADGSFRLVTNFFTSFGYFSEPDEDVVVLREVRRVLEPDGTFVFDFLNADRVRAELKARDERLVEGRRVIQTRALVDEGRAVEKRIEILDPDARFPRIFYERVRLYSSDELHALLQHTQMRVEHRFGSYSGDPLRADSPRVILLGRAG